MRTYTLEVTKLGRPVSIQTVTALNEMDALHMVRNGQFPSTVASRVIGIFELDGTPVTLPGRGDFTRGPKTTVIPEGMRWVACSKEASYAASLHRHLIYPGHLTTRCGASASHPEVWRGNTRKPECLDCFRGES